MGNAEFKRYHFKLTKKFATVRHYEITSGKPHPLLTSIIKFSIDRAHSNARGQLCWLHLREPKKWAKEITGLRPIFKKRVFYGDIPTTKKSLLLFQFNEDSTEVFVDVFPSFYPLNKGFLGKLVKNHTYHI